MFQKRIQNSPIFRNVSGQQKLNFRRLISKHHHDYYIENSKFMGKFHGKTK